MIIVLENADFSTKNIGTIEIPTKTLEGVSIQGSSTCRGKKAIFVATASYDDSTTTDVSSKGIWSATNAVEIADGIATIPQGASALDTIITFRYNGYTSTFSTSLTYDTVDDSTREMLTLYGKTFTTTQEEAVQDFLNDLSTSSWGSKINTIIAPILCAETAVFSTYEDAAASMLSYDLKTRTKKSLNKGSLYSETYGSRIGISSNGVMRVGSGHSNFAMSISPNSALDSTSLSAIRWDITTDENFIGEKDASGNYSFYANALGGKKIVAVTGLNGAYKEITATEQNAGTVKGISYKKASPSEYYGSLDGVTWTGLSNNYNNASGTRSTLPLLQGESPYSDTLQIGVWAVGDFMSQEELNACALAIKNLVDAIRGTSSE